MLDNYTWYELGLFSERFKRNEYREWNKVRHLMHSSGNYKAKTPEKMMPLEYDREMKQGRIAQQAPSMEKAKAIYNRFKNFKHPDKA